MLRHLRVPFLKRLSDECDRAVIISGQGLRTSFHLSLPLSTCTTSHLTRFPDGRHAVRGIRLPNYENPLAWTFSLILTPPSSSLSTPVIWSCSAASSCSSTLAP